MLLVFVIAQMGKTPTPASPPPTDPAQLASAPVGGTWTISAADSGQPAAKVNIQISDANQAHVSSLITDANGFAVFNATRDGTYTALGPGSPTLTADLSNGPSRTGALPVHSPYTLTVHVIEWCSRVTLHIARISGPQTTNVPTDPSGTAVFTNLPQGDIVCMRQAPPPPSSLSTVRRYPPLWPCL